MDPFSSGLPRASDRGRRSAKKKWILIGLVVLAIGFVLFALLAPNRSEVPAKERADSGVQSSEPAPDPASADIPSSTGADDPAGGNGDSERMPVPEKAQDPAVASNPKASSHDHGDVFVTVPEDAADGSENASPTQTGGGEGYDPLGTGAEPGDHTEAELERVRSAAARYITYAYGYTGEAPKAYRDKLSTAVIESTFDSSQAGAEVSKIEDTIEAGGLKSAAVLTGFETKEQNLHEVTATATFEVGESYDDGSVSGEKTTYTQDVNIQLEGTDWKVAKAQQREETQQ